MSVEPLDHDRIKAAARARGLPVAMELHLHDEVDSTNRLALDAAAAGAPSGYVCMAETQTSGRGRQGKRWCSPRGNLYLSLLWRLPTNTTPNDGLSIAVGVTVAELVSRWGADSIAVKWPNDVYCGGSKLAGILVETSRSPNAVPATVVGIGLNFQMPESNPGIDQTWTDLSRATGGTLDRNRIAGELIASVLTTVDGFQRQGLEPLLPRWRQLDMMRGREVEVWSAHTRTQGTARGIDPQGALLVDVNGIQQRILSGEVSLRPIS